MNENAYGQDIVELRERFLADNPDVTWCTVAGEIDSLRGGLRWRIAVASEKHALEHVHGAPDLPRALAECLRRARFNVEAGIER